MLATHTPLKSLRRRPYTAMQRTPVAPAEGLFEQPGLAATLRQCSARVMSTAAFYEESGPVLEAIVKAWHPAVSLAANAICRDTPVPSQGAYLKALADWAVATVRLASDRIGGESAVLQASQEHLATSERHMKDRLLQFGRDTWRLDPTRFALTCSHELEFWADALATPNQE